MPEFLSLKVILCIAIFGALIGFCLTHGITLIMNKDGNRTRAYEKKLGMAIILFALPFSVWYFYVDWHEGGASNSSQLRMLELEDEPYKELALRYPRLSISYEDLRQQLVKNKERIEELNQEKDHLDSQSAKATLDHKIVQYERDRNHIRTECNKFNNVAVNLFFARLYGNLGMSKEHAQLESEIEQAVLLIK